MCARLAPLAPPGPVATELLARIPAAVAPHQTLFAATGAVHAAAAFTATGEVTVVREDVGRHNAVDKVVGALRLADQLPANELGLFVSGRASVEMVQKASAEKSKKGEQKQKPFGEMGKVGATRRVVFRNVSSGPPGASNNDAGRG